MSFQDVEKNLKEIHKIQGALEAAVQIINKESVRLNHLGYDIKLVGWNFDKIGVIQSIRPAGTLSATIVEKKEQE